MTDRATLERSALTPWYPVQTNPARRGIYEVRLEFPAVRYSHWNGRFWGYRESSPWFAHEYRDRRAEGPILAWRGLTWKL